MVTSPRYDHGAFQRQTRWTYYPSSVFEPKPHGTIRGIGQVLFDPAYTTIEAEKKQDEQALYDIEGGQSQQEGSRREVTTVNDDQHKPAIENGNALQPEREMAINNGNHCISGNYQLFDLLFLSTTTGDISVAVMPQPADPMNPDEPARLRIQSQSGNVSVSFTAPLEASHPEIEKQTEIECVEYGVESHYKDPQSLPIRPYEIEIETDSGAISGQFIVSTSVRLSTKGGIINATLIPVASDLRRNVSIFTQTTFGSQQIQLTDPVYMHGSQRDVSAKAQAAHLSHHGGSMHIKYPSNWAGTVRAQPGSGSISLVGQGLEVVRGEDGSVDGCKGRDGGDWWGELGNMDVFLGSKGAAMFVVG